MINTQQIDAECFIWKQNRPILLYLIMLIIIIITDYADYYYYYWLCSMLNRRIKVIQTYKLTLNETFAQCY